jgi:hypothetical protein
MQATAALIENVKFGRDTALKANGPTGTETGREGIGFLRADGWLDR